jgi:hypothetical protein
MDSADLVKNFQRIFNFDLSSGFKEHAKDLDYRHSGGGLLFENLIFPVSMILSEKGDLSVCGFIW